MSRAAAKLNNLHSIGRTDCGDTSLHRRQPLAHLVVTLAHIVSLISIGRYDLSRAVPFLIYPVWLIIRGELPAKMILRKLLFALPLIVLLGLFNPLLDRAPLQLGEFQVAGGWISFLTLLVKGCLSVLAALLLVCFCGQSGIAGALRALHVPRILVALFSFIYRYIFLLSDEAYSMSLAYSLRSAGRRAPSPNYWGSMIGQWAIRSYGRARRIYSAMLLRGFSGEMPPPERGPAGAGDIVYTVCWCGFFICARLWNISELLGGILV